MFPSPLFQSLTKVWEGLKITGLGIGMVFLVLSVLSVVIYFVGQAIYKAVSKEKVVKPPPVPKKVEKAPKVVEVKKPTPSDEEIAAVIGAAIAAYLYLKARAPKERKEGGGGAKDLWSFASKVESLVPGVEVTRENLDEIVMKEGIWR